MANENHTGVRTQDSRRLTLCKVSELEGRLADVDAGLSFTSSPGRFR